MIRLFQTSLKMCCLSVAGIVAINNALSQKPAEHFTDNVTDAERARVRAKAVAFYPKLVQLHSLNNSKGPAMPEAGHVLFRWPMRANSNYDDIPNYYSIVNYRDLGPGLAETDWRCGTKTYNNHDGLDVALWPFWWRMKDNFNVFAVAAAPGIVIDVVENNIDTRCELFSYTGNQVAVLHSDSTISYYIHIKQDGAIVAENDVVEEGQALAYIASSGRSTYPHLHFQVEDKDGNPIEPFKNTASPDCNTTTTDSWWQSQKPYWEPQINRIATHYTIPALWGPDPDASDYFCQLHENPALKNNFLPLDSVYFVIYFHDLQTNDSWDITVTEPDGTVWYNNSGTHTGSNRVHTYHYYSGRLPFSAPAGTWKVTVSYRSVTYRHYFSVLCPGSYTLSSQTGSYGRIASDFIESTAVAASGNEVRLQAGNSITLKPGFEALQGSTFKARIKDCNYTD